LHPDVNQQAVVWYDAAKEEVAKVARTATDELCPHNATEQNLIRTADDAAQRLEDVARKIERLLTDNK